MEFKETRVLVTGGTRGIGRGIVEAFAVQGARVAFTYRSSAAVAEELEEATGGLAFQCDAADFEGAEQVVAKMVKAWGGVDVLVNNAGITRDNLLMRMSESDWDAVINANLKSVFNYSKAVYRIMMRQRYGRIVNISSIVGLTGNPGQANYAASKAGIIGISKSLAKELGARGVTVNVVSSGVCGNRHDGRDQREDERKHDSFDSRSSNGCARGNCSSGIVSRLQRGRIHNWPGSYC